MRSSQITISSSKPKIWVAGLVGPDGPKITDGYGGWSTVDRPRRQGVTLWTGRPPFKMTVDFVLDGYKKLKPVEIACASLERMALPPTEGKEPPVLKVSGDMVPHPGLDWVLEDIQWGETIRNSSGRRLRQVATLTFIRYVKEDRLREQKASARARGSSKGGKKGTIYKSKSGDTIAVIAAEQLGNVTRWAEIGDLNDIREPNKPIKTGTNIKLP